MAIVVAGYGLSQFNLENPQAVVSFLPAEVWLTTFLVMVIPFWLAVALGEGPLEMRTGGALAVGLMTVCLLVYAALEYRIRKALTDHGATFPNQQGQSVQNPTARWVLHYFVGINLF
jgi:hypothetical protein